MRIPLLRVSVPLHIKTQGVFQRVRVCENALIA
jgi:hypothetical protein